MLVRRWSNRSDYWLLVEMQNSTITLEGDLEASQFPIWFYHHTFSYLPKWVEKPVHGCLWQLYSNRQNLEAPRCPSKCQWIKKLWYTHIMECHSVIKRNELPFCESLEVILNLYTIYKGNILYDSNYMPFWQR